MIFVHSKSKFSLKRWIGRGKNAWLKRPKKAYFLEIWKVSIKSIIKKLFGGTIWRFSGIYFLFLLKQFGRSSLLSLPFSACVGWRDFLTRCFAVYLLTYLPLHGELYKGFSTFLISMIQMNKRSAIKMQMGEDRSKKSSNRKKIGGNGGATPKTLNNFFTIPEQKNWVQQE